MEKRLAFQAITFGMRSFRDNLKVLILSVLAAGGVRIVSFFGVVIISIIYVFKFVDPNFLTPLQTQAQTITMFRQLPMNQMVLLCSFAIVAILTMLISGLVFMLGFTKLMLNIYDHNKLSVRIIFSQFRRVPTFFAAIILYGILVAFGMLLLILPGIYWLTRFSLFSFFIVDQNAGIIDSLRLSYRATKGAFWDVFLVCLFLWVIIFVFSCIGRLHSFVLLITIPLNVIVFLIVKLSFTYLYRKLAKPQEIPVGV